MGFSSQDILFVFQAQTQGYKESKSEETLPVVLKSVYLLRRRRLPFLYQGAKKASPLFVFNFTCRMVMLYVTKLSFTKVEFGLNHVDIFASIM